MKEVILNVGKAAITQGEEGDYLYVVQEGTLECTKIFVYIYIYIYRQGNPQQHS